MFGGMVLFSKASTALIKLVIPEAPSAWPTFGLTYNLSECIDGQTESIYRANVNPSPPKYIADSRSLNRVTGGSPRPMTLRIKTGSGYDSKLLALIHKPRQMLYPRGQGRRLDTPCA